MRRAAPRLVALVSLLAVGVVLVIGVRTWLSGGEPRAWEATSVEGRTLVLRYLDSSCRDREHVEVRETPTTVTVTVRTRTLALSCDDSNAVYSVAVTLDAPLGDRALRDGACTEEATGAEPCTRAAPDAEG